MSNVKLKKNIALTFNILANVIPLWGVLFWGWHPVLILFIYWQEAVIVGLYNIPKILLAKITKKLTEEQKQEILEKVSSTKLDQKDREVMVDIISGEPNLTLMKGKLVFVLFFIIHYSLFLKGTHSLVGLVDSWFGSIEKLVFLNVALISFIISHGISFWLNYYNNEEYKRIGMSQQMLIPYKRLGILFVTIIFGVMLSVVTGTSNSLIIVFVVLKIVIDLWLHKHSHELTFEEKTGHA